MKEEVVTDTGNNLFLIYISCFILIRYLYAAVGV